MKVFVAITRVLALVTAVLSVSLEAAAVPVIPPVDASKAVVEVRPNVTVHTTVEKLEKQMVAGHEIVQLRPAEHLVAGDEVIYTLAVRNEGTTGVDDYVFTSPIPEHMVYVADSAVGPGVDISYSVDGGRSFASPGELFVHGADGKQRAAVAADYTTIRWLLRNRLNAGSMALARFRALVR
jgi:uncharacterized repeat protein (TIGR01451 family)